MKKIIVVLLALVVTVAGWAQDKKFEYGVSGSGYATTFSSTQKDVTGSYAAYRIIPTFSLSSGAVETVLTLEIDQLFGATTDADETEAVTIGGDSKVVEVKNAYTKVSLEKVKGLSFLVGVGGFDFPLVLGDSVPMFNISYDFGSGSINLYYMKTFEGALTSGKSDAQIYGIDLSFKTDSLTIRPLGLFYEVGETSDMGVYKDSFGIIPGISVSYSMEQLSLAISGVYAMGEDKTTGTKYKGYALDVAAKYALSDSIKIGPFLTMISGDDPATADDESFINATVDGGGSSGSGSGINSWRLFIIEDGGAFTTNSDVASAGKYDNTAGYLAVGLSMEAVIGALSAKFQGAYVVAAQKPSVSYDKKDMGIELDLNLSYEVEKGANIFAEFAYLKTGDFYKATYTDVQDAMYVNVGLSFSL